MTMPTTTHQGRKGEQMSNINITDSECKIVNDLIHALRGRDYEETKTFIIRFTEGHPEARDYILSVLDAVNSK